MNTTTTCLASYSSAAGYTGGPHPERTVYGRQLLATINDFLGIGASAAREAAGCLRSAAKGQDAESCGGDEGTCS